MESASTRDRIRKVIVYIILIIGIVGAAGSGALEDFLEEIFDL